MIVFLLWAIVLILFWPIALIIGVAWLIPVFVRVCLWCVVFSIKAALYIAVGVGVMISSLANRRSPLPPRED
jgi:hypothetical protein